MGYFPGLDDENEEDMTPVSSIAGPATTRDQVMQRISEVRNPSRADSAQGGDDSAAAIDFARQSAQTAGMGRALNALASGTGFKADNSAYDNMEKQGTDVAQKAMNREALVKKAIEDRRSKEALAGAMGKMKDRAQSETERHNRAMESAALEKAGKGSDGKTVAAERADKLAGHAQSLALISDLRSAIKSNEDKVGPLSGRLTALNPYDTTAKALAAQSKIAAQNIGKSLEGGKLTDQDIIRYQNMLPSNTDTPAVAYQKLDLLERMVQQKKNADVETYGKAGYNVNNFDRGTPVEIATMKPRAKEQSDGMINEAQAAGPSFTAEDVAMLKKAKARLAANPGDEKAKQVLGVLRSKGLQ